MAMQGSNAGEVAIRGYGLGEKAAVALAIVATLPVALPSLCLLSFVGLWLAIPVGLLTVGFIMLRRVIVKNCYGAVDPSQKETNFLSDARAASEIMMRAIDEEARVHGRNGLRIDPPGERLENAAHTPVTTIGKGKDKVEEIDGGKAAVDRMDQLHSPGARDVLRGSGSNHNGASLELSVASPSSNPPKVILQAEDNPHDSLQDKLHAVGGKQTRPAQKYVSSFSVGRSESATLIPVSGAVKEPKTAKHLEPARIEGAADTTNGEQSTTFSAAGIDEPYGVHAAAVKCPNPIQSGTSRPDSSGNRTNGRIAEPASKLTSRAKGITDHTHKKKSKHHKGRARHDHT